MKSTDITGTSCTACGYKFEAASGYGHARTTPRDGDISICIECANVDVFQVTDEGTITLRKPTDQERAAFDASQQVTDARYAVLMCGGKPSPSDLATVQEFAAALAQPTKHRQLLALLEMGETPEERDALARHASRCCAQCGTHTTPHKGCILR